jgi:NAD dependent epimerase/dehydratase family enzyme
LCCGLGGSNASGNQFVSWIHDADFVRAIDWLIAREDLEGPVNIASPNPLPNRHFVRALRQAWHQPISIPAAKWMIEIGSFLLQTESELVLISRRVLPGRLLASGFRFNFPEWPAAAREWVNRWRSSSKSRLRGLYR